MATKIEDADQDTKVDTEESADEDVIRFDTYGIERMKIEKFGPVTINRNLNIGEGLSVKKGAGFNTDGGYNNFTIKGHADEYLFHVDADRDAIGIGVSTPLAKLCVRGGASFNDLGEDYNFVVRGDNDPNLFCVDASTDNIGIGTYSPSYKLEIYGGSSTDDLLRLVTSRDIDNAAPLYLRHNRGTGNAETGDSIAISFQSDSNTTANAIRTSIRHLTEDVTHATRKGGIIFRTQSGNDESEKMRITGDGKVGIGDTSPSEALDVNGDVRADRFIEYSPIFLGDAIKAIKKIKGIGKTIDGWSSVDHKSLPAGVKVKIIETRWYNKKTNKEMPRDFSPCDLPSDKERNRYKQKKKTVYGRSLSNAVQVNQRAIQQLIDKIANLEKKINV